MKQKVQIAFLLLFIPLFLFTSPVFAQKEALTDFLKSTNLKYAGIGFKIVDLSSGKTVCTYNENQALCPASTMKLMLTASALEILGKDFKYKTIVFTDGIIDGKGVLNGNIYIQGVGDPTLGSEFLGEDQQAFLKEWLAGIRNAGIRSITGSVIALDDLYGYEGVSSKWLWEDLGNYYASGTYGISVFDNTYRLYLKSGAAGTTTSFLKIEPEIAGMKFDNQVKAAANNLDSAYIYGMPFSYNRRIFGTIPQNKPSFVVKGDIPDPGFFLASCLSDFLNENSVPIGGKPSTSRLKKEKPTSVKILATTESKPVTDIIRVTNYRSNNHYAEHLFRKLQPNGNSEEKIKRYWKTKGIDTNGLFMFDGSGLSPSNGISAALLTDILAYMNSKSRYASDFEQSLPIAGKNGTVASFLKNTSLDGKAHVKSGSIAGVQSYAGYVDKNGKKYVFAILVNKYTGQRSVLKNQIENLLVRIFDNL